MVMVVIRAGEGGQSRFERVHMRSLKVLVRFIGSWSECLWNFHNWLRVVKMGYKGGSGSRH